MACGVDPAALRAARERAGLTQHQLARLIGVAGGERISRWELGTSEPRPDILVRLAKTLDLPAVALLDLAGDVPDLRALRFTVGLSAAEVAARVHVATVTYQRWEAGRWERLPANEDHLRSLARALRVRASVVLAALEQARAIAREPQSSPEA
jgi:transcriptional regulator with XRE-family HTH domain